MKSDSFFAGSSARDFQALVFVRKFFSTQKSPGGKTAMLITL